MNRVCSKCGLEFYRESGYYVGSIYINYGATVAVVIISFLLFQSVPDRYQFPFFLLIALFSSLAFFRHSRSLWITLDYWISPWKPADRAIDS